MQPVNWLYIRGMKTQVAVLAAVTVLFTVGCGGSSTTTPTTTSTTTTTPVERAINSWQEWGQTGLEWLGECNPSAWTCVDVKLQKLERAAGPLPPFQQPSKFTDPIELVRMYRDEYRNYESAGCPRMDARCLVIPEGLSKTILPNVKAMLANLAAGKNVGGE